MRNIAFLYPGQGSQYVGMGKDLYEANKIFKETFDEAEETLKINIKDICFFGPKEKLQSTEITQLAVLIHSIALSRVLLNEGIIPKAAAGLSLGEYTAFHISGVIDFKSVLEIVRKRGTFMKESSEEKKGTMAAVLGLNDNIVKDICSKVSSGENFVIPANYNCPGQIAISGSFEAVEKAVKEIKASGGKAVKLQVDGSFHSPMMEGAALKLERELNNYKINEPIMPVVINTTGEKYKGTVSLREIMKQQITSPVLWSNSIKTLIGMGVDTFVEIGPGKSLSGFLKRMDKNSRIMNAENIDTLEKVIKELA
ncbi:ACP S-malonyltransferase [Clostridium polynesiense]|uniref:ACP S-malonyltransferase n=1 Tax=Clostridium polynesiense TaxID=1325933 RepID=UPI00058EBCB6|nr:ACP S-malonyltransferase [Clostridium polynesiense]